MKQYKHAQLHMQYHSVIIQYHNVPIQQNITSSNLLVGLSFLLMLIGSFCIQFCPLKLFTYYLLSVIRLHIIQIKQFNMDKRNNKHNQRDKPNWDWTHIECYLKTLEPNRKSTIWNLTPNIILTNPSTQYSGPNVRLYIDTEKSLQYSNDLGWNWHKSWNIPNISLRLQIKDQTTGDFLLSPRNLFAQIFAVKKISEHEKNDRMTLIDVGIRGQSKMEMIDGQVYFSAIKFSSTTYNNQGINFNLLIVLYINQGEFEKPKILTSVISPPIFVDSRRSARDYQQKKFSSFVEPFGYHNIDKQFIKRQNKSKSQNQIVINNDPEGFYNYITAPNIRHKVKHPVFLTIKFSNCVKICYNSKIIQETKFSELLQNLQNKLLKQVKTKPKQENELNINIQDKHFLFVVSNLNDSLKKKKVIQSIQTMQNEFIGIVCGNDELLDIFVPIQNIEALKKAYKETYQTLVSICQNYQPEYPEESQDQYYSEQNQYEQSEKSSKKIKKEFSEVLRSSQRQKPSIISNNKVQIVEKPKQKQQETMLKKQQLFDSHFQAPVFFNQAAPQGDNSAKKPNNTIRTSGFTVVNENHAIFDTTKLNKAFSNNLGNASYNQAESQNKDTNNKQKNAKISGGISQNLLINQNNSNSNTAQLNLGQHNLNNPNINSALNSSSLFQSPLNLSNLAGNNLGINMNNNYNSIYQNLMYSNIMLSNWLGSVKNNNTSLYDGMNNHTITDQLLHKNNIERYLQAEQQHKLLQMNRLPIQNQQQQSIICLIQQIGLYKELLSQVTYQNQLLSRDINFKQQQNNNNGMNSSMNGMNNNNNKNQPKFSHNQMQFNNNLSGGMSSLGFLGGMNQNLGSMNLNNMGSMNNLGSLSGFVGLSNMSNGLGSNMNNAMGSNMSNGLGSNMLGSNMYINQANLFGNQVNLNPLSNQNRNDLHSNKDNNNNNLLNNSSSINTNNGLGSSLGNGMNGMNNYSGISNVNANVNGNNVGVSGLGNNYELIKSMIIEQMKKQAELKERQKNQNQK